MTTLEAIFLSNQPQARAFFLSSLNSNTSFSEVFPFSSPIITPTNSISIHKSRYKHYSSNIDIQFPIISLKSIITTHGKTVVKTADLAYFN